MNPIIHLFSYLCLAGFFHYALSAEPPGPDLKDLARIYERTLAAMALERPEFTNQYKRHPASSDFSIYHGRYGIPFYRIEAPIHMTLYPDSYRVCSLVNTPLQSFLDAKQYTNSIIPKDSVEKAVETARAYLKSLGVSVPDDCHLSRAEFNRHYKFCWEVRWKRYAGAYPYEESDLHSEGLGVIFHETLGCWGYAHTIHWPSPKRLDVKVYPEEAALKASRAATLVFRTPYYRAARMDGFIVKGMKSAELVVATPNWLLDPKRAVWIPDEMPKETRLCWLVRFITVDAKLEEHKIKYIPPEIIIYIDAATGEVVGADFT